MYHEFDHLLFNNWPQTILGLPGPILNASTPLTKQVFVCSMAPEKTIHVLLSVGTADEECDDFLRRLAGTVGEDQEELVQSWPQLATSRETSCTAQQRLGMRLSCNASWMKPFHRGTRRLYKLPRKQGKDTREPVLLGLSVLGSAPILRPFSSQSFRFADS